MVLKPKRRPSIESNKYVITKPTLKLRDRPTHIFLIVTKESGFDSLQQQELFLFKEVNTGSHPPSLLLCGYQSLFREVNTGSHPSSLLLCGYQSLFREVNTGSHPPSLLLCGYQSLFREVNTGSHPPSLLLCG